MPNTRIVFSCDAELLAVIKQRAAAEDRNVANWIQHSLRKLLGVTEKQLEAAPSAVTATPQEAAPSAQPVHRQCRERTMADPAAQTKLQADLAALGVERKPEAAADAVKPERKSLLEKPAK